jgi:hypothetical protein
VELAKLLEQHGNLRAPTGKRAAIGNGYQHERELGTAFRCAPITLLKLHEPSPFEAQFNSNTSPPDTLKSSRGRAAARWLCLSEIPDHITNESLCGLRVDQAWTSPPNMVSRLNARWAGHIHSELRIGAANYRCMLVSINSEPEVQKEHAAVAYANRRPDKTCIEVLAGGYRSSGNADPSVAINWLSMARVSPKRHRDSGDAQTPARPRG